MMLDELLLYIRAYRLLLISERELWPSPRITPAISRAMRRHRKGLKLLIAWADVRTCASPDNHRQYWRYRGGQVYECSICRRLLAEVS